MIKRSRRKEVTPPDLGPLDPDSPTPRELDDVRQILFGAQLQAYERRLDLLEKRSEETLEDFRAQLAAIERYVQNEVNTLVERLKQEIGPHSALLDEVIRQRHEEATQLISAGINELRSTTPDGGTVSNLLRKVADRLNGSVDEDPTK